MNLNICRVPQHYLYKHEVIKSQKDEHLNLYLETQAIMFGRLWFLWGMKNKEKGKTKSITEKVANFK